MGLLQLLFPPKCSLCKANIKKGTLCPFCAYKLRENKKIRHSKIFVDGRTIEVNSLFAYENDTVKSLLFALKRKGNGELFRYAADLYLEAAGEEKDAYAVVNVPRSRENVAKYGYDHVKKAVKIMCKKRDNFQYSALLKRKRTLARQVDQKQLDVAARISNVKGKFRAVKKDIPKNILLIDDVITTSSTASECIRKLFILYPDANIKCAFLALTGRDFSAI